MFFLHLRLLRLRGSWMCWFGVGGQVDSKRITCQFLICFVNRDWQTVRPIFKGLIRPLRALSGPQELYKALKGLMKHLRPLRSL